jgi:hypothetical protein
MVGIISSWYFISHKMCVILLKVSQITLYNLNRHKFYPSSKDWQKRTHTLGTSKIEEQLIKWYISAKRRTKSSVFFFTRNVIFYITSHLNCPTAAWFDWRTIKGPHTRQPNMKPWLRASENHYTTT